MQRNDGDTSSEVSNGTKIELVTEPRTHVRVRESTKTDLELFKTYLGARSVDEVIDTLIHDWYEHHSLLNDFTTKPDTKR